MVTGASPVSPGGFYSCNIVWFEMFGSLLRIIFENSMVLLSQSAKRRFLSTCCQMDLLLENPLGYVGMMSLWVKSSLFPPLICVCVLKVCNCICWTYTDDGFPHWKGWSGVGWLELFESWFVGGALLLFFPSTISSHANDWTVRIASICTLFLFILAQ